MEAIRKRIPPKDAGRRLRRGIIKGEEGAEGRIPGREVKVAIEKIIVPRNWMKPA